MTNFHTFQVISWLIYNPLSTVISLFLLRKCYRKIKAIKNDEKNLSYCKISIYIIYVTYVNLFAVIVKNGLGIVGYVLSHEFCENSKWFEQEEC